LDHQALEVLKAHVILFPADDAEEPWKLMLPTIAVTHDGCLLVERDNVGGFPVGTLLQFLARAKTTQGHWQEVQRGELVFRIGINVDECTSQPNGFSFDRVPVAEIEDALRSGRIPRSAGHLAYNVIAQLEEFGYQIDGGRLVPVTF
jgi:hypothetical protein